MTNKPDSDLILYQTEDGLTKVEVHLLDETVWLIKTNERFQSI